MNHPFTPSALDITKCGICKYDGISHGDTASCECCDYVGPCEIFKTMLMCPSCIDKEKSLMAEHYTPAKQDERVDTMNEALNRAREIDNAVQVRTDLFNAATVSIVELKNLIDTDATIQNKPYALAEMLTERFSHFRTVIFDANEKIIEATNQQKAIQVYLNNMMNQLRQEEREKLKLQDINYQPKPAKVSKPRAIKTTGQSNSKKLDKVELRKYASELGISEFVLQTIVVSKGITVEAAANILRKSIAEAKSEAQ